MGIDELPTGEARESAEMFGNKNGGKIIKDGGIRIVVLQRGWVAVGRFSQNGYDCRLDDAAIIRNWGTSKGLPELVKGPIENKTVLDKASRPIRFHELTVILSLDCVEDGWKRYL